MYKIIQPISFCIIKIMLRLNYLMKKSSPLTGAMTLLIAKKLTLCYFYILLAFRIILQYLILLISTMQAEKKIKTKKFRDLNDEERKKLIEGAKKKNADGIVVIAQCHPKCKVYQELPEFRYIVAPLDKVKEIDNKIKKKIGESDKRLATQSVFLFSQNKLLNRETSFDELYNKHKNFKDEVLYMYFANVESF